MMTTPTYSWVTHGSPLWHRDKVQSEIKPLPSIDDQKRLEKGFVNDGVKTKVELVSKKQPIIPPYDAVRDKYAQAYFQSPLVKAVMERTRSLEDVKIITNQAIATMESEQPVNIKRTKERLKKERFLLFQERKHMRTYNKLSTRRRIKKTPTLAEYRLREEMFRNDAVNTDKQKTRYKDIIPIYDASQDMHCKKYFTRPDIQSLVSVTCSPRDSVASKKHSTPHSSVRSSVA